MLWDIEVSHQDWWNCATAGLYAPRSIEQQHRPAATREFVRGGGAGRPATDDNDIISLEPFHDHPLAVCKTLPALADRTGVGISPRCG
jgi:hypothetical protein